jgi:hypothetical protein
VDECEIVIPTSSHKGTRRILGLAATRQAPNKEVSAKVEKATGSIRGVCILAAVVAVLALAPAAFAQTADPYAGTGGGTQGQVAAGGGGTAGGNAAGTPSVAAEPTESDSGLLAFTGLDVALIAGGGLLLLASGVGLSRLVARNPA